MNWGLAISLSYVWVCVYVLSCDVVPRNVVDMLVVVFVVVVVEVDLYICDCVVDVVVVYQTFYVSLFYLLA